VVKHLSPGLQEEEQLEMGSSLRRRKKVGEGTGLKKRATFWNIIVSDNLDMARFQNNENGIYSFERIDVGYTFHFERKDVGYTF
jgi:hypothetical protein